MNLRQPDRIADTAQDHPQGAPRRQSLASRRQEQHPLLLAAEAINVIAQRRGSEITDANPALFLSLCVSHEHSLPIPVDILKADRDALRCPHSGVEEEEDQDIVPRSATEI